MTHPNSISLHYHFLPSHTKHNHVISPQTLPTKRKPTDNPFLQYNHPYLLGALTELPWPTPSSPNLLFPLNHPLLIFPTLSKRP